MKVFRAAAYLHILVLLAVACGRNASVDLEEGFVNPPKDAMPRVYWFWMNGNITREGVIKDIEWMHRIGMNGFHIFDGDVSTPQVVPERLTFMSEGWKDALNAACTKASEYGMDMAMASSSGWSLTGGPWVTPEEAIHKVVWSEKDITGGGEMCVSLPHPPEVPGLYQNIPPSGNMYKQWQWYEDIAVVAIRLPDDYEPAEASVSFSAGPGSVEDYTLLSDGDLVEGIDLKLQGGNSWVSYEFPSEEEVYGVTVCCPGDASKGKGLSPVLECSDDGTSWRQVAVLDKIAFPIGFTPNNVLDVAFPAVKSRFFRLRYESVRVQALKLAEYRLHFVPRVNRSMEKAGFIGSPALWEHPTPATAAAVESIVLTDKVDSSGVLRWSAPDGKWKVLRFGASLTGRTTVASPLEATGLEVDKLSRKHAGKYYDHYLDMLSSAVEGHLGKGGLRYLQFDSWEARFPNWTDDMFLEFRGRRGYDMEKWLPAIAGYVVEDAESSDRFLWDFRRVIGELIAENHYDLGTEKLAERGMERCSEAHEVHRAFIGDGMRVNKTSAVPMSTMWTMSSPSQTKSGADIREQASVANIYGQKYVGAESFTAGSNAWGYAPSDLKRITNNELVSGVNRFIIHESAHQPLDDFRPGVSLGPFGQMFNRHETWAEQAGAWMQFLGRSSFMLSEGRDCKDILYFYGEDTNTMAIFADKLPSLPCTYGFDFVNADALVNDLHARGGRIVAPSGMRYRLLVIGNHCTQISLPALRAIAALVRKGVTVIGPRPVSTPSLSDNQEDWTALRDRLWGEVQADSQKGRVRKGVVSVGSLSDGGVQAADVSAALDRLGCSPDAVVLGRKDNEGFWFRHRDVDGTQVYWIATQSLEDEAVEVSLRTHGLKPELWNPVTGGISELSYRTEGDRTVVSLNFHANGSCFVVFRSPLKADSQTLPVKTFTEAQVLEGQWELRFPCGMGAPESIVSELIDLKNHSNPYIRYYAGQIVYSRDFDAPAAADGSAATDAAAAGGEVWLELGEVHNLASVRLNGRDLGVLWDPPFRVEISDALLPGTNHLEIEVTNLWVNRLIGDHRGDGGTFTHTVRTFYSADSPLISSGLLGPVRLVSPKLAIN